MSFLRSSLPWSKSQHIYQVPPDESKEVFLDRTSESDDQDSLSSERTLLPSPQGRSRMPSVYLMMNIFLFVSSIGFFALGSRRFSEGRAASARSAVHQTSYFSPVLKTLDVELIDVHFNGTLYPPKNPSFSREAPGVKEAEAHWEYFEPHDIIPITREDVIRLGKDPETAVKLPDEHFGLGDDAYASSLDVTHKIHCLNELRKMTFEHHPSHPFSDTEGGHGSHGGHRKRKTHSQLWWYHLRHCVDMLAQDLMCHADTDLYIYEYRDTQMNPYPDFAIHRKCRNLNQLLEWRDKHSVDLQLYAEVMQNPRDSTVKQVPHERKYYEINGFDGSDLFPNGEGFEAHFEARQI